MSQSVGLITFKDVSFEYDSTRPILKEASFSVRRGAKFALMGQNGAGKSTIFGLITKKYKQDNGDVNIEPRTTIAVSRQVIPRDELTLTLRDFFLKCFKEKIYDIDPKIDEVLEIVNLTLPKEANKDMFKERIVKSF